MMTNDRLIDFKELMNKTSLHKTKLYELINAGYFYPIKLGKKTVFSEKAVNKFIQDVIQNGGIK